MPLNETAHENFSHTPLKQATTRGLRPSPHSFKEKCWRRRCTFCL